MLFARIYSKRILKNLPGIEVITSFNGKIVNLTKSQIEVLNVDLAPYFISSLTFSEEDPFSETTSYLGNLSDQTQFRLLKPGDLNLFQLRKEHHCEEAFTIASIDPQGFAFHFVLKKFSDPGEF